MDLISNAVKRLKVSSPALFWLLVTQLTFILCSVVMIGLDPRKLSTGASPWLKPIIFDTSVIVYAASMIIVTAKLVKPIGPSFARQIAVSLFIVTGFIFIQAIRGVRTIFSVSDPINSTIFAIFGLAIAWNTYVLFRIARIFSKEDSPLVLEMRAELRHGIKLGLYTIFIGSLLGHAIYFASPLTHLGLRLPDVVGRLPSMNLISRIGSLRVAHSLGLHGLQIFLVLGWLFSIRFPQITPETKRTLMTALFGFILFVKTSLVIWAVWGIPIAST